MSHRRFGPLRGSLRGIAGPARQHIIAGGASVRIVRVIAYPDSHEKYLSILRTITKRSAVDVRKEAEVELDDK